MEKIRRSTLQLDDEIELHQTGWIIQRIGWALIVLVVIAAAFGFFGTGPVSRKEVSDSENTIRYERFARYESPMNVLVFTSGEGEVVNISISQTYLNSLRLDKITPSPSSQRIENGMTIFTFPVNGPATINFFVQPTRAGTISGTFQVNRSVFEIRHFVYP